MESVAGLSIVSVKGSPVGEFLQVCFVIEVAHGETKNCSLYARPGSEWTMRVEQEDLRKKHDGDFSAALQEIFDMIIPHGPGEHNYRWSQQHFMQATVWWKMGYDAAQAEQAEEDTPPEV